MVSLKGTYDFDRDGLSEFLAIEKLDPEEKAATSVAYYEIDELGVHAELWRFISTDPIRDIATSDMDRNGAPEILVLTEPGVVGLDRRENPWLHWFPWETEIFSQTPQIEWTGTEDPSGYRPMGMAVIDMDNDGRDEVAIASGSPRRSIALLRLTSYENPSTFEVIRELRSPHLSSGYGQIHVSTVDHNQDGYRDLMAISRELNTLTVQIFENEGGAFVEGPLYSQDIGQLNLNLSGLIVSGIHQVDIDQDGSEDVILPFRTGVSLALNVAEGELEVSPIQREISSLFTFPESGLEDSAVNEILLERAEIGITGTRVRKLKLEAIGAKPAAEPEPPAEVATTTPARKVRRLEVTTVERAPEEPEERPEESQPEPSEPSVEPSTRPQRKVRKLELTTLEKEEVTPAQVPPISVPPGVDVSDTVFIGTTYIHALEVEQGKRLHAFRPTALPMGASFDASSRSISWTPDQAHIGLHKLAYEVEYELTENVGVQETAEAVQVTPRTESESVELFILVLPPQE